MFVDNWYAKKSRGHFTSAEGVNKTSQWNEQNMSHTILDPRSSSVRSIWVVGGVIRRGDEKEDRNSELKTEREDMEMEKQALKEEIYKEIE